MMKKGGKQNQNDVKFGPAVKTPTRSDASPFSFPPMPACAIIANDSAFGSFG
jgi:hypothetical protein